MIAHDVYAQTKPEEEGANDLAGANLAGTVTRSLSGSSSPDDYYQTVAINALLSILRDQSLSGQHHKVIEAIMSIFKTQGLKCVSFLPQVSQEAFQRSLARCGDT